MVRIRIGRPDDADGIVANDRRAFGASDETHAMLRGRFDRHFEPGEFVVADDGGQIVGNAGVWPFQLTLPGGAEIGVGGVTWAAVSATHRRRGLLRRMLERTAVERRERGEFALALYASEGGIYENVGFGVTAQQRLAQIDARRARFRGDPPLGSVEFVHDADLASVLPPIFDRARRRQVGQVDRSTRTWARIFDIGDDPPNFTVIRRDAKGRADGYARYHIDSQWNDGHPAFVVHIDDLVIGSDDARCGLWRFLVSIDMAGTVQGWHVALDDPLGYLLTDVRLLRTREVNDNLWLRLLDVEGVFGARRYAVSDELVVEVTSSDPVVAGRWLIGGDETSASVTRTRRRTDVVMTDATLAAVSLGGTDPAVLARAGLVAEGRRGAAARATRFLRSDPLPLCTTHF